MKKTYIVKLEHKNKSEETFLYLNDSDTHNDHSKLRFNSEQFARMYINALIENNTEVGSGRANNYYFIIIPAYINKS